MSIKKNQHLLLTEKRAKAFARLFGGKPDKVFPFHSFNDAPDAYLIDVMVFRLDLPDFPGRVVAAVTNGMSDVIMRDGQTGEPSRCELIQYFHDCDPEHARRLYDLAWIPLFDGFALGPFQTMAMPDAVVPGSALNNALFMPPIITAHREFSLDIDGLPVQLLWHIPISDEELAYKKANGINALVKRMETVELPWILDEAERPDLLAD
jgi:hypothetical protein